MLTSKENTNLFGKLFGNASENTSENAWENASENAVWGAAGAPQRGEASMEKARHVEKTLRNVGGFRIVRSAGSRYGIELSCVHQTLIVVLVYNSFLTF